MRKKGFLTIGYGNNNINDFINKLKECRVTCIVDVRSCPYSKFNISFNKEELRDRLAEQGISYFWLGNKLGARYDKIKFCDERGIVDYEKVAKSEKFKEGISELIKLFHKYNVCVMCSEKDPLKCHRFLLISRNLKEYNIHHIMPDGSLLKNCNLEEKMLSKYSKFQQLSLFDDNEDIDVKAYREQGFKTAYISQKVQEMLNEGITVDFPDKIRIYTIGVDGKNAEEFYTLLKDFKVKRVIDVRGKEERTKGSFAIYPDIAYFLKLNCISYENMEELSNDFLENEMSNKEKQQKYIAQLENKNLTCLLLSDDELDGTCFMGKDVDYRKCHRSYITKALKQKNKNIIVRHLK